MAFFVAVIAVLVLRLLVAESEDVFISKHNGKDYKNCGQHMILPCNSLEYVFENKISVLKLHIRLDGGDDVVNPYKYAINKTFLPEREITITATGKYRPTILTFQKLITYHASIIYCKRECILNIHGIRFYNAPLVTFASNATVLLRHCLVESSFEFVHPIWNLSIPEIVNVDIFNCTFLESVLTFGQIKYLNIKIDDSHMLGQKQDFTLLNVQGVHNIYINLRRSMFKNNGGISILCMPSIRNDQKIFIFNTKFINTRESASALHSSGCSRIYLKHCEFAGYINTAIWITKTRSIIVTRTTFINNTGYNGGALYSSESKCLILKFFFFNNTARNGGAVYFEMGIVNIIIKDSRFIANSAIMLGGSIHVGKQQRNTRVVLINATFLARPTFPSSAGIIIYSIAETSLLNVRMKIASTLLDWPMVEGLSCDKDCIRNIRTRYAFTFTCPENHNTVPIFTEYNTIKKISNLRCVRCRKDTYSTKNGSIEVKYKHENLTTLNLNTKCQGCPSGALCDNGVVSRGNFWGYLSSDKSDIIFIPCPSSYCCSSYGTKCTSYNTCNSNRYGVLCGSCKSGFRINYFDGGCIAKRSCWKHLYWVLYLLYVTIYSVILLYYKDIFLFILKYIRSVKSKSDTAGDLMQPLIVITEYNGNQHIEKIDGVESSSSLTNSLSSTTGNLNISRSITGFKTIVFFFYQIENLLQIKQHQGNQTFLSSFKNAISSAFNSQFIATKLSPICPSENLTSIGKEFIDRATIPTAIILLILLLKSRKGFSLLLRRCGVSAEEPESTKAFKTKVNLCLVQLALLGYTGISAFCIKMMNCININDKHHLYIQGDVVCYSWWQYLIMVFFCIWIVPFPFTTYISVKMLEKGKVSVTQFYVCFSFPPYATYQYILKRKTSFDFDVTELPDENKENDGILELFTKPCRTSTSKDSVTNWEVVVLIRRLILSAMCICIINPVFRMLTTFPTLLVFLLHHWYKSPFHSNALNRLETASLSILLLFNIFDLIWALDYMHDLSRLPGFNTIKIVFIWIRDIYLSLPPLIILLILSCVAVKKIAQRVRGNRVRQIRGTDNYD